MPKVSNADAAHIAIPGYVDSYEQDVGGWNVSIETHLTDMDQALFFKGAPNDQCQARHVGYVLKGRFGVRRADGVEEIFEAGDAFIIEPGHTPLVFAGGEIVAFTPSEDAKQQSQWMMPNIIKYAEEHGVELPAVMPSA